MNEVLNNIVKRQYKRYINGHVESIRGTAYLVSKGFVTIEFSTFVTYMKRNGVEIEE